MTSNTDLYRAARDQLVDVIRDYAKAVEVFAWPQVTGVFNWATDWFDVIARGNERTALWIVEEGGEEHKISFAEMADASDRVATWLGRLGVGKGDRITRGGARFVIANDEDTAKFDDVEGDYTRIVVGHAIDGWHPYATAYAIPSAGPFNAGTTVDDPMLIYFTSGTTSKPKLVEHSQVSYSVGHL